MESAANSEKDGGSKQNIAPLSFPNPTHSLFSAMLRVSMLTVSILLSPTIFYVNDWHRCATVNHKGTFWASQRPSYRSLLRTAMFYYFLTLSVVLLFAATEPLETTRFCPLTSRTHTHTHAFHASGRGEALHGTANGAAARGPLRPSLLVCHPECDVMAGVSHRTAVCLPTRHSVHVCRWVRARTTCMSRRGVVVTPGPSCGRPSIFPSVG